MPEIVPPSTPSAVGLHAPPFPSILVGVDDSPAATEAVRQAMILSGPQGRVHELRIDDAEAGDELLAAGAHHDLLALGAQAGSRAAGILLGATATAAVHRSPVPVLVARRPPPGTHFPSSILLAVDAGPGTVAASEAAVAIACRHGGRVAVIGDDRRAVLSAAALVRGTVGLEPVVLDEHEAAPHAIADAAAELNASLIVIGSRGLRGVAALGSVSERTAHMARCSVLVVRPRERRGA